jgi:hypothetical protein
LRAIGSRVEGVQGGGGEGITIIQGKRDLTTIRGGKEKYNINSG